MSEEVVNISDEHMDYIDLFNLERLVETENVIIDDGDVSNENRENLELNVAGPSRLIRQNLESFPANFPLIPSIFALFSREYSSQRLMALRVIELEERLRIFQFAIWKIPFEGAREIVQRLVVDITSIDNDISEFTIVSRLNSRRQGVLVRVSSLSLKILILNFQYMFRLRGYSVDIA